MKRKIDEIEMLAWIEGELGDLPPDKARALADAVDADPELKSWLVAAAADRSLLAAWGERACARAPSDLVDDAIALAERRALVGAGSLPAGRAGDDARRGAFRLTPARLALAATIVVGATAAFLYPLIMPTAPSPAPAGRELALAERNAPPTETLASAPKSTGEADGVASAALSDEVGERPSTTLAIGPSTLIPNPAAVVADADRGWSRDGVELVGPPAPAADDAAGVVSMDEAVALARAGRLGVVVRAQADLRLDGAGVVRPAGADPAPLLEGAPSRRSLARARASADAGYAIEVSPDAAGIGAMRESLLEAGAERVEFVELEAPTERRLPTSLRELLWWRGPVTRWPGRVSVPVTIDPAPVAAPAGPAAP